MEFSGFENPVWGFMDFFLWHSYCHLRVTISLLRAWQSAREELQISQTQASDCCSHLIAIIKSRREKIMKVLSKTRVLHDMEIFIIYSWKPYSLTPRQSWKLTIDATGILTKIWGDELPIPGLAAWQEWHKEIPSFYGRLYCIFGWSSPQKRRKLLFKLLYMLKGSKGFQKTEFLELERNLEIMEPGFFSASAQWTFRAE